MKREVTHLQKISKIWGTGTINGTLCNRMALGDGGTNVSDVRGEVTCKFCLKRLAALDLRAANEAKNN